MTYRLVENQFNWQQGVGARKHCCEWLLFFFRVLFEDPKVCLERSQVVRREALIPIHQFLERGIGAERALSLDGIRGGKLQAGPRQQASQRPPRGCLQETPA